MFISGKVQGVGYRYFTRKNAESLGVTGWVKNLPDGRVEAVFEGDPEDVQKMLDRCKKGPVSSNVINVKVVQSNSGSQKYADFEVV